MKTTASAGRRRATRRGARGMDDVLYAVHRRAGPRLRRSSSPLTRRTSPPRAWSSIVSQIPNAVQSSGSVETRQTRADLVVVRGGLVEDEVARVAVVRRRRARPAPRSPNDASMIAAAGFSRRSSPRRHGRIGEVRLRDHEPVGGRGLLDRLLAAEPVLRVHGRDRRARARSGASPPGRRAACRGSAPDRRGRSSRRPRGRTRGSRPASRRAEQVAQLVGEIAAERAADAAAPEQRPCARRPAAAGGGRSRPRPAR